MRHLEGIAALAAFAVLAGALYWRRLRTHPYARCLACRRRPRRNAGSRPDSYGRCRACKGTGERLKFMSWLLRRDQIRGGR